MDKVLESALRSDKSECFKKQLCHKVEELSNKNHAPAEVQAVLAVVLKISLETSEPYITEACKKIYLVWGKHNRTVLENYFSPVLLQGLLDERVQNQKHAMWFIHETMLIIRSDKPQFLTLCQIIQFESVTYLGRFPAYETVTGLCKLMIDFHGCIPRDNKMVAFCNSLITAAGTFEAPKSPERIKQYISDVTFVIGNLLSYIWKNSEETVVMKSLHQIFAIISHEHKDRVPSLALAGIVPCIPTDFMDSVVKQTVSDLSIPDVNIRLSLARMLDWLSWPTSVHLDKWIIAFFQGLASVHKYTIIMEVIETKIENVYEKLHFPVVRENAFMVLSHMLLGYQHSPEPFHKIVQNVPETIRMWKIEGSDVSYDLMCRFSKLLHTLMSHHLGFPDLYEPVIHAIKGLPKPSSSEIKKNLEKCSWKSSQKSNRILTFASTFSRRSETGKTGLVNLGNTCYMNSVLQVLYMCDRFCQEVLSRPVSRHQPIIAELRCVFAFLSATQRAAYAPSGFLTASRPPWFTAGLQQDCSEFMRYLYDQIHEQELTELKCHTGATTTTSAVQIAENCNENQYSTIITRMFMGKMVTAFKCLACCHESMHMESFTDLSLAFPEDLSSTLAVKSKKAHSGNQKAALAGGAGGNKSTNQKADPDKDCTENEVTLDDLLKHYLKPEKLKGDNKYYCDVCSGLQDGERVISITAPPEYLNLTLLRFAYNVKARSRSKIFTDVSYPKTLHLPVHDGNLRNVPVSGVDFKDRIKKSKTCRPSADRIFTVTYALCAVIVHSGYSSDSGHYYCYARHSIPAEMSGPHCPPNIESDPDFLEDQWYLFNDSRVSHSKYETFCNITKMFGKDTPYVLLYKRIYPQTVEGNIADHVVNPVLPADLRAAVDQDNRLFLQEQELAERSRHLQAPSQSSTSFYKHWKGPDDKGPPGSCGGGGGGGLSTNRLVF